MTKEGWKTVSVHLDVWELAEVLSKSTRLPIGRRSITAVFETGVNELAEKYSDRFAKYEGKTIEEALRESRQLKKVKKLEVE